jgi:hypothetical protein
MKGAMADPLPRTIKTPSKSRHKMIGKSQNFFRAFRNPQRSRKNSMFISPKKQRQ